MKSLQTNSIQKVEEEHIGKFQCDASDRRRVTLPDGQQVETTCLVVGEFDLLAVSLFGFENEWRFAFAKNEALPRSKHKGYTEEQRIYLLATLVEVSWPLKSPFELEPYKLLEEIVQTKINSGDKQ